MDNPRNDSSRFGAPRTPEGLRGPEQFHTVVIGGGQSGLSVGYHLARRGLSFVILDANQRIGDAWRQRWDSLRLFTQARYDGLSGMPFPASRYSFPTKDEMADYLEAYATRFKLPVRTGVKVDRVSRRGNRYLVSAGDRQFEADHVVIAMANYQVPRVPPYACDLDPDVLQVHAGSYRNPAQLHDGGVLIVGVGNSGAEIAKDVARHHRTWLSGRENGHLPFRITGLAARYLLLPLMLRVVFHRVLTVNTPMGRKMRTQVMSHGGPLIRVMPEDLDAMGVQRVPRVTGVRDGLPLLEDGRLLDVANVIWCTGFQPGFSWIDLPVFTPNGAPIHELGVATNEPGLYFVGLPFIYSMSSAMIHGVGRDAARIAGVIAERSRATAVEPSPTTIGGHRPPSVASARS
jgi:putative flavoprotein involved in K+ transport